MKIGESLLFLIALLLTSCQTQQGEMSVINASSTLDSLFEEQSSMLSGENILCERTAALNENREKKNLRTDAAFWSDELKLLSEVIIEPTELKSDFSLSKGNGDRNLSKLYRRKNKDNGVQRLTIDYHGKNQISQINCEIRDESFTFSLDKDINLSFDKKGRLSSYAYAADKTTLFGDATHFSVSGLVTY